MACRILLTFHFLAGKLPRELGKLANLTHFDAQYNSLSGALSIRAEHFILFVR